MLVTPDPAFALLLAALRWPADKACAAIANLPVDDIEWDRFVGLAKRHRVGPLAFRSLEVARARIPQELVEQLHDVRRSALFAEMRLTREVARLCELFARQGIASTLLKGPELSLRAFNQLGLRTYRDLDLLIDESSIRTACTLLEADGYELIEPRARMSAEPDLQAWRRDHKDALFRHSKSGLLLELHWRLFDNARLMPLSEMSAPVALGLAPLERIHVLQSEAELHYLCLHGALHGWSRLRWLADINALVVGLPDSKLASSAAALPAVAQALILCRDLLGAQLGQTTNLVLDKCIRGKWLAKIAWFELLRSGTSELESTSFGSTVKNISHYGMLTDARSLLEEAWFDLRAQPRLPFDGKRRGGRIGDWMARHLFRRRAPNSNL